MPVSFLELKDSARDIFPGLFAALIVAFAAHFLSEHHGGPVMLFALLLGIAFNFLSEQSPSAAGIHFAARHVLRLGVALLGFRMSLAAVVALGWQPLVLVISTVLLTIGFGIVLARMSGAEKRFGLLTGGSVAICGASAALALASVLPQREDSEKNVIFTVVTVTALSTLAMIAYPLLAKNLGLDDQHAGILFGATIHDVAQVVGAGYSVSDVAGDTATIVKLVRVLMLMPVVFVVALIFGSQQKAQDNSAKFKVLSALPGFAIAFVIFVAINSTGIMPTPMIQGLNELSRWCVVTAVAALGMKTSFGALIKFGFVPLAMVVGETVFLLALTLLGLALF